MPPNLYKVRFSIAQDEDGYPPFTVETMWCIQLPDGRFCVDNIPFFVKEISYCDLVSITEDKDGRLEFGELLEAGGHSTLRVIFFQENDKRAENVRARELADKLKEKGCLTSISPPPVILAVDVPPSVQITAIQELLSEGEKQGLWTYEEATLAHSLS